MPEQPTQQDTALRNPNLPAAIGILAEPERYAPWMVRWAELIAAHSSLAIPALPTSTAWPL